MTTPDPFEIAFMQVTIALLILALVILTLAAAAERIMS